MKRERFQKTINWIPNKLLLRSTKIKRNLYIDLIFKPYNHCFAHHLINHLICTPFFRFHSSYSIKPTQFYYKYPNKIRVILRQIWRKFRKLGRIDLMLPLKPESTHAYELRILYYYIPNNIWVPIIYDIKYGYHFRGFDDGSWGRGGEIT